VACRANLRRWLVRRKERAGHGSEIRSASATTDHEEFEEVAPRHDGSSEGPLLGGGREQQAAELGDGAGDAQRARVRVPVLLRGAAEERGEGRLAQQLGAHGEPLHGAAFLAHAHRHVARRDARVAASSSARRRRLFPRAELPEPSRRGGGGGVVGGRDGAGEPPQQPLHGSCSWSELARGEAGAASGGGNTGAAPPLYFRERAGRQGRQGAERRENGCWQESGRREREKDGTYKVGYR
jgi:hypothetical protein